jgi:hypothetical protein
MRLAIDIERYLGFRKAVSSDSWRIAGEAYILKLFCTQLYSDLGGGPTPSFDENERQEDGESSDDENVFDQLDTGILADPGDVMTTWNANSGSSQKIRDCIFKVWFDYYGWDGTKFQKPWVRVRYY